MMILMAAGDNWEGVGGVGEGGTKARRWGCESLPSFPTFFDRSATKK